MIRVLSCLVLLSACADPGPERVEVPTDPGAGEIAFGMAGPGGAALIVPVHINGHGPYDFVLDTGATITCVDDALASVLRLPDVRGVSGTAASVGGQSAVRLVSVDSMKIGEVRALGLQACVVDLEHLGGMGLDLDGLVGLNVLSRFRVTLDFERNVLTLEEP